MTDTVLDQNYPTTDFILRLNRRLVYLIGELRLKLPVNHSHLLIELSNGKKKTAKEISEALTIEKSTLSRMLLSLSDKKYLSTFNHPNDSRSKLLTLTKKGEQAIITDIFQRNELVRRCCEPLSDRQTSSFISLLRQLADGVGALPLENIRGEDPAESQIRRLTRTLGAINKNFLDTGRSIEEFQVLFLLQQHRSSVSFSVMQSLVGYELTVFSKLISKLEGEKLIQKIPGSVDKRSKEIQLTKSGTKIAAALFGAGEAVLTDAFAGSNVDVVGEFQKLAVELFGSIQERVVVTKSILTEADRRAARSWMVKYYLGLDALDRIPAELALEKDLCFGAFNGSEMIGFLESKPSSTQQTISILIGPDATVKRKLLNLLTEETKGPYTFSSQVDIDNLFSPEIEKKKRQSVSRKELLESISPSPTAA